MKRRRKKETRFLRRRYRRRSSLLLPLLLLPLPLPRRPRRRRGTRTRAARRARRCCCFPCLRNRLQQRPLLSRPKRQGRLQRPRRRRQCRRCRFRRRRSETLLPSSSSAAPRARAGSAPPAPGTASCTTRRSVPLRRAGPVFGFFGEGERGEVMRERGFTSSTKSISSSSTISLFLFLPRNKPQRAEQR